MDTHISFDPDGNIDLHNCAIGDAVCADKNRPAYEEFVDTSQNNLEHLLNKELINNEGMTLTIDHPLEINLNSNKTSNKPEKTKAIQQQAKIFDNVKSLKKAKNTKEEEKLMQSITDNTLGLLAWIRCNIMPLSTHTASMNDIPSQQTFPNNTQKSEKINIIDNSLITYNEIARYLLKIDGLFQQHQDIEARRYDEQEREDHLGEIAKELEKKERKQLREEWRVSKEGKLLQARADEFKDKYLTLDVYFGNKTRKRKGKDPYIKIGLEEHGLHTCVEITPGRIKVFKGYYDKMKLLFYVDKGEIKYSKQFEFGKFSLSTGVDYKGNFIKSIRWAVDKLSFAVGDKGGDPYGELLYTNRFDISGFVERLINCLRS